MIIRGEVSQKEKDRHHMISLMCGIQNRTRMNLSRKQTASQTQRMDLWLPGGGGWWRGSSGLANANCKMQTVDKQQGPAGQHRELYATSCDKPWWRRIWKKNVYMWPSHFDVQHKWTWHCKSTMLQLRKRICIYLKSNNGKCVFLKCLKKEVLSDPHVCSLSCRN